LLGLLAFALLINLDAIVVKRVFDPDIAGNYGPVVTLAKINLFIPLGIGLVLFPKTTQRQAVGRDPRPVLLLALAATLAPGLLLSLAYFLFSGVIVHTVFTDQYADPGLVLGLAGLATTLFAGINIWLNYALSLERHTYVYTLLVTVLLQIVGMGVWHESLIQITAVMVVAGFLGNVAGAITTLRR
jgi:O-antigen/teichoic acid export membrane protein